jgi:hypothetical protein
MQALLLIYSDEAAYARLDEATRQATMGAYFAYSRALREAGAMRGGDPLLPSSTARRVRVGQAGAEVLDGPYAETREQLAGYYLIEVPDMAAALEWAARCPGASHGLVEVRGVIDLSAVTPPAE